MNYSISLKPYQRNFTPPLKTNYGIWQTREGIIINLIDNQGKIGQGEIAPIPWFGSETILEAWEFCQQFNQDITEKDIFNIPQHLPACQFGLESALNQLKDNSETSNDQKLTYSYLLPNNREIITLWKLYTNQNITTFKLKIAINDYRQEINFVKQLMSQIPPDVKLRLDANGGLTLSEAQIWLEEMEHFKQIEFLEQPLSPPNFNQMLQLSQNYQTPIALDESVANLKYLQECYDRGWQGIYIIKAAIMGYPSKLESFCQSHNLDLVFSSVFETEIGKNYVLKLAKRLSNPNRAVGFGTVISDQS
jgi:o-succinylbenzoate synthase